MKDKGMSEAEAEELRKNPVNQFTCCEKTMGYKDFKEHLREIHKLEVGQMRGKKSMLMHMDGDKWFSWQYQWTLEGGLQFKQYTMQARSKDSMMY